MKRHGSWWLATVVMLGGTMAAQAGSVNLTVYNNDLALVRDTRTLSLDSGENEVRVTDVTARIDPTSVLLSGDGLQVLEQNFEYDIASADRILDRYLGEKVTAVTEGGEAFGGDLMSYAGGSLVLLTERGPTVLTRERVERIDFPELPGGLTTRPTLVWRLDAERGGDQDATLSYLTGGLQWHAEYVALVNEAENALDLSAWVSLENQSGASFQNANLQLVAGDVARVQPQPMVFDGMQMARAGKAAMEFQEESFFEYHLYTLDQPVTVKDRQTKQVTLFPTAQVSDLKKVYRVRGGRDQVNVDLEFRNGKEQGLGMALPKGKLRVYKRDSRGGAQFVGEDLIDHTPRDEKIEVTLGNAFDIVAERTVMDQRQVSRRVTERTVEVKLRNHKDGAVEILVDEPVYGDWEVISSTHQWEKKSAYEAEFKVSVPADGESTLQFTIRVTT